MGGEQIFKYLSIIYRAIARTNRNLFVNPINKKRLKNNNFSIISNNCIGGLIYHDLNKKFLTPTVNLFFTTKDFINFVENLNYYLNLEIEEVSNTDFNYPVGKLGDITVYFVHYKDMEEARLKWNERCKRINFNNLYIMMTDNDGCSIEIIQRFEKLPYKNKVLFTNRNLKSYRSIFYDKGFGEKKNIGDLTLYENIFGKKKYDNFHYINWLNS